MAHRFRGIRLVLPVLVASAIAALIGASPAAAASLEELRKDGSVGERFDGFVVARSADASPELRQQLDEINAKRKAIYEKRASDEGVPVEQVGKIYAKQIFDEAPAGTWFQRESKEWVQK